MKGGGDGGDHVALLAWFKLREVGKDLRSKILDTDQRQSIVSLSAQNLGISSFGYLHIYCYR